MRKSRGKVSGSVATSSSDDGSSSGSSSSSDDDSDRQTSTPKQRKKRLSTALMATLHVSHQKLKDQGPDETDSKVSIVTSPQDRQGQATSTGTSTRTPKSIRKSLQQSLKGLGNSITSRLKLDDESLTATKSRGSLRGNDDDGSYMSPPFRGKSNILGALSLSEELRAAQNNQTSNPSMFYNDIRLSPQDQKEPARRNSLDAHILPLNDVQSTTASTVSSNNKKEFRFRRRGSAGSRSVNSSSISNGGAISSESSPLSRKSRQSLSSSELNYTGTDTTSETNMVSNKRPAKFNDRVERFLDELKVDYDNKEGSQQRVSSSTNESSFSNIEELTNNPNHEESLLFPEERSMEFSEDDWNPSVSHSMLMEDKLTAELLLSPRGGERRRSRKKQAEQKATSSKSTSEHRNKRNSKSQKPPRTASNNSKDSQSNGNQRSRSRARRDHRTSSSSRKGVRSESSSRKRTSCMSGSRHSARASRTTETPTTKLDSEMSRPSPRGSSPAPGPPPPPPTIPPDEEIAFSTQKSAHSRTSKRSSTHSRPPMSPTPQTPRGGSKSGRKVLKVPLSAPARPSKKLSSGDLPLNDIRDGSKSPGRRRSSAERSSKSPSRRSGVRRSRSQSSRSPGRYRERSDRESRSPGRYRSERESKSPGRNRSPGRYQHERESKSPSRSRNRSPGRYQHERESNRSPGRYRNERESKSPGRSRRSQMESKSPGRSRRSSRKVAPSIIPPPLTSEGDYRDRSPYRDRPQRDFTNALDLEGFSPRAHAPQKESIDDFSGNASSLPVLSLPNISSLVGSSDDDSQSLMTAELPILKTVRNWNAKHVPSRETAKRNSLLEYESQKSFGTSSSALNNSRRSVSASPHGSRRKLPNPKFRMSDASSRTQRTSRSYDRDVEADGSQRKTKSYHGRSTMS